MIKFNTTGPLAHLVERPDGHREGDRYMSWVYILQSEQSKRYYIGSTEDIELRLEQHNAGKNKSTKPFCPWKIRFKQEFVNNKIARTVESRLKKYKSKIIIEKIIQDGYIMGH